MKNLNINYLPVLEDKKLVNLYFYENNFFSNNKIHNDFIIMQVVLEKDFIQLLKIYQNLWLK